MSDTNWFNELIYWSADDFESRLNPFISTTGVLSEPDDCNCDKPAPLTDTLIGSLESFFGEEAKDDEIIGAESLPTTPQGWGVRWRPEWFPDGRGRNLVDENLRWADLRNADLGNTDLRNANLRWADLRNTDLRNADLRNADLSNSDLRDSVLRDAVLVNADLWRADLREANLIFADLLRADLRDADLRDADLRGANLTGAINLDVAQSVDFAVWNRTTCPDGSMNIGTSPCD